MNTKRIAIFHLFNDYSGSPLVLRQNIMHWTQEHFNVELVTSKGEGFLSDLPGVKYTQYSYQPHDNKWIMLLKYLFVQWMGFWWVVKHRKSVDMIFLNTILPFGPALAGKICRKQVVYHVHEPRIDPKPLDIFLKWIIRISSDKVIFVSHFLKNYYLPSKIDGEVIHNTLSEDFLKQIVLPETKDGATPFNVLMLASMKSYKGIYEFISLAGRLPELSFTMVLNASKDEVAHLCKSEAIPENLKIYSAQRNVHPFYKNAHLVLNLSHPEKWTESFGMTILEAFHYGLPAIVPVKGGVTELVTDGQNGYHIPYFEEHQLVDAIKHLAENKSLWQRMSAAALASTEKFCTHKLSLKLNTFLFE